MIRKTIFKFCCSHCNRTGDIETQILDHEKRCLRNPARVCGFCHEAALEQKKPAVLVSILRGGGLEKLRSAAQGCPGCMLAAILQNNSQNPDEVWPWMEWDYRAEVKKFRRENQSITAEAEMHWRGERRDAGARL